MSGSVLALTAKIVAAHVSRNATVCFGTKVTRHPEFVERFKTHANKRPRWGSDQRRSGPHLKQEIQSSNNGLYRRLAGAECPVAHAAEAAYSWIETIARNDAVGPRRRQRQSALIFRQSAKG